MIAYLWRIHVIPNFPWGKVGSKFHKIHSEHWETQKNPVKKYLSPDPIFTTTPPGVGPSEIWYYLVPVEHHNRQVLKTEL